jgi:predicted nucleotidyltransferase
MRGEKATNDSVTEAFAGEVRRRLGNHVREIRLFGSRARGDAGEDSDYDMLVVVDHRSDEVRKEILEVEVDLLNRFRVLVASLVRNEAEWLASQRFPFGRNIIRESREI